MNIGILQDIKMVRRLAGGWNGCHGYAITTTALCPDGKRRQVKNVAIWLYAGQYKVEMNKQEYDALITMREATRDAK